MRLPRDHARGLRKKRFNLTTLRLRELERIIAYRFNSILPYEDVAEVYLLQAAKLLRRNLHDRRGLPTKAEVFDRLVTWSERWAHFTPVEHIEQIAELAMRQPRIETADQLGKLLGLTFEERGYLKITTIGACDVTKAQRNCRRKQRKRERDRESAAKRRREQGAVPRPEYLKSSFSAVRPWEAEGISRRTWERQRRRARG